MTSYLFLTISLKLLFSHLKSKYLKSNHFFAGELNHFKKKKCVWDPLKWVKDYKLDKLWRSDPVKKQLKKRTIKNVPS